jgi:hypothetical protein
VLNLEAIGVSLEESIAMTDRLRSELVNSNYFTVVERSKMDEILKEQGLQQSGCTSDECAVEIGKLLNIRLICAGSIAKVGVLYSISLRMIDVQTGKILLTVTDDCRCTVEEVLTSSIKKIADKLVTASKSEITLGPDKGKGDIYLKSSPSDAKIYINGQLQQMRTPAILKNLYAGECMIKVVKGDFVGSRVVKVTTDDIINLSITLGKGKGGIKIYSTPPEAEIMIGEQVFGRTPKVIRDLPAGDYVVYLRKTGYLEAKHTVKVNLDEFSNIDVKMIKPAGLYITSTPANAEVFIRGQYMGKTPLKIEQLNPERVPVELIHQGYKSEQKYVDLQESKITSENIILNEFGSLIVTSQPPEAEVYINDNIKGITPITIRGLPDEKAKMKIKKEHYELWQQEIILSVGIDQHIDAALRKKSGILVIKSDPPGMSVLHNDNVIGITPLQKRFPYGEYTFTLDGYPYERIDKKFILDNEQVEEIVKMHYIVGKLQIKNRISGSSLYINGSHEEPGKSEYKLPLGDHDIKLTCSGFESKSGQISINEERICIFNGELKRKSNSKALLRSIFIPGWGQLYQEKRIQPWIYPIVYFSGLVGSYYSIRDYNDSVDHYEQVRQEYLHAYSIQDINHYKSQMISTYDDVESKEQIRNIMLSITGGIWLWNLVDIFVLPAPYQNRVQLSGSGNMSNMTVFIRFNF